MKKLSNVIALLTNEKIMLNKLDVVSLINDFSTNHVREYRLSDI